VFQSIFRRSRSSLRHITTANVESFVQRSKITLIRFNAGDGPRFAAVYTSKKHCKTKLVETTLEGMGVEVYLNRLQTPTTLYINICTLDRHVCLHCGKSGQRLKYCIKCRNNSVPTRYSSKDCQVAHWPTHAPLCG
jgi:hypothetical protein